MWSNSNRENFISYVSNEFQELEGKKPPSTKIIHTIKA